MIVRATTTPGIEDLAAAEVRRLLDRSAGAALAAQVPNLRSVNYPWLDLPGVIAAEFDDPPAEDVPAGDGSSAALRPNLLDTLYARIKPARLLYHVAVHVAELEWDGRSLESLLGGLAGVGLDRMASAECFRVSCTRAGTHEFQSPDVEREVGAQLVARYGTRVDLEHYTLHVKIDVIGRRAFAGYQLTGRKGLDRRYPWEYRPRVSLRTPIAAAMLCLAGFTESPGALVDPFCGSGTILLEATSILVRHAAGADVRVRGRDWDPRAIDGTRRNLEAAGFTGVEVEEADACELHETWTRGSIRYIVTNPPFGIRLARGTNFQGFYRSFLRSAAYVLEPGGALVLLVGKRRASFARALQEFPEFSFVSARTIEMGGVYPSLQVLRRTELYSGDPFFYHQES